MTTYQKYTQYTESGYADFDPQKILHQRRIGDQTWSIIRLEDWPITIQDSVYRQCFVVVRWTAYEDARPNYYERCSGTTAAICADMEDALLVLDRHAGNRAAQWTVEFSEYCGYDSMTHAWKINGPKNRIYIDCANFGQKSCDYDDQESIAKAKAFADHVCAALNAYHP